MISKAKQYLLAFSILISGSFVFLGGVQAQSAGTGAPISNGAGATSQTPDDFGFWDVFLFRGDDISIVTLKEIIGDWSGLSPTIQPIFSEAIMAFNLAVLAFGSVVFAYTAVAGTLQSAHDGQLLGKSWSTVWVPFRFTMGVSMLIPTASGLCMAQLGMLWLLSQGVGLASNVWERAVTGYSENGGQYIAGKMASEGEIRSAMRGIFANELCLAVMRRTGNPEHFAKTTSSSRSLFSASSEIRWGGVEGSGYDNDMCGSVSVAGTSIVGAGLDAAGHAIMKGASESESGAGAIVRFFGGEGDFTETTRQTRLKLANAQYEALLLASDSFGGASERIMAIIPDQELSAGEKIAEVHQNIGSAYLAYRNKIVTEISAAIETENKVLTDQLVQSAKRDGWFTAGTWFYQIARSNEELNTLVGEMPTVATKIAPMASRMMSDGQLIVNGLPENEKLFIEKVLAETDKIFARNTKSLAYEEINPGTHKNGLMYAFQGLNIGGVDKDGAHADAAVGYGYDPTNPAPAIIQLKNVGDYMIGAAIGALAVGKISEIASSKDGAKALDTMAAAAGPKGWIAKAALKLGGDMAGYLSAAFIFIGLALFATGIILAFWLPMLPFVNWIGGIIGWVVATLEMLIATPVWVAAHLHPEGEGVASRYAASGYMIILELLLRPVLMVFGLIIAIIIVDPLLNFVASQFFQSFAAAQEDSLKLLIAWIMKLILFTVVCWIAVNFTFKAINSVPNGVMRWIGGMAGSNSDMGESVGENTRAMVVAGSHKMTGALQMGKADNRARNAKENAKNAGKF